jgi:hypothetical protein
MVICSLVGRLLLARAAFSVGKVWGVSVLVVPLAPLFFRLNYKELAYAGGRWRLATTICVLLSVASGGSSGTLNDLPKMLSHREEAAVLAEVDATEARPESAAPQAPAKAATPPEKARETQNFVTKAAAFVLPAGLWTPTATPAPVLAPVAPATPAPPTLAERMAANQREFTRLGDVYEALKKERGYLRKGDPEALAAYNGEAAKYQAALVAARADQVELNKQLTAAKTVAKK